MKNILEVFKTRRFQMRNSHILKKDKQESTFLVLSLGFLLCLSILMSINCKKSPESKIRVISESFRWREWEQPYDLHSDIEHKLKKVGFQIVPEESDFYDASLLIVYKEEEGPKYTIAPTLAVGGTSGTNIDCRMELKNREGKVLFEHVCQGETTGRVAIGGCVECLYKLAVKDLKKDVYFLYLGQILATRFGIGDEVNILIKALKKYKDNHKLIKIAVTAAEGLGNIGDESAIDPLMKVLDGFAFSPVKKKAKEALKKLRTQTK